MYKHSRTAGSLGVISAIVLSTISPTRADDFTVNGNLNVKNNAVIVENLGIGVTAKPVSKVQILNSGSGVGIFLGDRTPFGQALFETDLNAPATHAFFAENGKPVFSVAGGGNGFFLGTLEIRGKTQIHNDVNIGATLEVGGKTQIHNDVNVGGTLNVGQLPGSALKPSGTTSSVKRQALIVYGDVDIQRDQIVPGVPGRVRMGAGDLSVQGRARMGDIDLHGNAAFGAQTRQMLNLFTTEYGIGVQGSALYQRSARDFFWYKEGTHSDKFADPGGGKEVMHLDRDGVLWLSNRIITPVLQITGGADVAEPFKMSHEKIPEGAVVIIDEENAGQLKLSESAYDKRVAGIVSGANGLKPGISLSQQGITEGAQNVALSGRVYVLADATNSQIKPGDLLTTSDTPGHAMKVTDHTRAQGAIIGKAMSAMKDGKGMVLVLVTLQ